MRPLKISIVFYASFLSLNTGPLRFYLYKGLNRPNIYDNSLTQSLTRARKKKEESIGIDFMSAKLPNAAKSWIVYLHQDTSRWS